MNQNQTKEGTDQGSQCIEQDIIYLKNTDPEVGLGEFCRKAAEKANACCQNDAVAEHLKGKGQKIAHGQVEKNIKQDFSGHKGTLYMDGRENSRKIADEDLTNGADQTKIQIKSTFEVTSGPKDNCRIGNDLSV